MERTLPKGTSLQIAPCHPDRDFDCFWEQFFSKGNNPYKSGFQVDTTGSEVETGVWKTASFIVQIQDDETDIRAKVIAILQRLSFPDVNTRFEQSIFHRIRERFESIYTNIGTYLGDPGHTLHLQTIPRQACHKAQIEDHISSDEFQRIQEVYNVMNDNEVKLFLQDYPVVIRMLLKVTKFIDSRFPESKKFLKLFIPPESEYGLEHLVIYISYEMPLEKAEKLLDELDRDCEVHFSPEFDKLISIDLAF